MGSVATREREGRANSHHLSVHAQRDIRGRSISRGISLSFGAMLHLLSRSSTIGEASRLDGPFTAIEAAAVAIVAPANDLAAAHDDAAVTIVERRVGGLLEAEGKIGVGAWRHFPGFVMMLVNCLTGLHWFRRNWSTFETGGSCW